MKRIIIFTGLICLFFINSFSSQELKDMFPEMIGWELKIEEKIYDATNLWELINGAADIFFTYNFKYLTYGDYRNEEKQIRVEIYKHSNSDNAFGIYHAEKMSDYTTLRLGVEGYSTDGALGFHTGKYYIKVLDYGSTKASEEELLLIGNAVHKSIGEKDIFPEEFRIMPEENKIKGSEGFILKNFIGYEVLRYAFIQDYQCENNVYKLFIMKMESQEETANAINIYFSKIKFSYIEEKSYYLVNDQYNGPVYIGRIKNYLFGAIYFKKECDITNKLDKIRKGIELLKEDIEGQSGKDSKWNENDDNYNVDISSGSTSISQERK